MLVRKSASYEHFKNAVRISDPAPPDTDHINYIKQKHMKLRNGRPLSRLGSAIAKRRQLLNYYRERRSQPGVGESDHTAATTEQLSHRDTASLPSLNPPSGEIIEEDHDTSSSNGSIMADSTSDSALPRLVDIARTQAPFECPICFTLQSFDGEKSWQ